ncbi:hypothetical protein [Botrimarina hoheduenensis]|uniref:hypothetical protein n=1 Tax=Botrimarina hoheduenensis TaxID=2528000 RepID=UPI0011B6FAC8|nr:hypothetical protein [Botrimarina hoheduenensis]
MKFLSAAIRRSTLLGVALGLLLASRAPANAAEFWLSTSAAGSPGLEAPAIGANPGEIFTLHLWGRPTPGDQLKNLSLNLVSSAAGVDFMDGAYVFSNTIDGSTDRFEYVRDSASTPVLTSEYTMGEVGAGSVDALYGINAFTLIPSAAYRGVGPGCSLAEPQCEIAADGEPAWRLATIGVRAVTPGAMVNLFLQVGDRGMTEHSIPTGDYDYDGTVDAADYAIWEDAFGTTGTSPADGSANAVVDVADYTVWRDHLGDAGVLGVAADVSVRFGLDSGGGLEPSYNALTDRGVTLGGDDPDAVITISSPSLSVPEPASLSLVLLLAAIHGRCRRPFAATR